MSKQDKDSEMINKVKILYLSHYFPPESNAPAVRVYELARHWVRMGHQVKVLTGFPNHPTGVIWPEYRNQQHFFQREWISGIEVIRTWIYPAANKGKFKRVINFLSFPLSAIFLGTLFSGACDIIIATSPQFLVGIAGFIISRLKRAPFIFEVRDLWPESIKAVGALSNEHILNFLGSIAEFLYRRAYKIVGVAESTKQILTERGFGRSKIHIILNGADLDFLTPGNRNNEIRKEYIGDANLLVSYIGTHGMAQGLNKVLEAAFSLRHNREIKFLFVGDGAEKKALIEWAKEHKLSNITFVDQQPRDRIPKFYQASDVCLVPLRNQPLFSAVLPSKIFEIMACGIPIILGVKGEAKKLIEEAGCGIVVEPEDAHELTRTILKLYENPAICAQFGKKGRSYIVKHFSRERLATDYLKILQQGVG